MYTTMPSLKLLPVASTSAAANKAADETEASEPSEFIKRESLKQLSTNALPPYKPDLSCFENPESVKTYCCRHCGDTYVCKSNWEFHTNRQSILIHFNCDSCETVQVFYNRCRLLAHITAHTDKGEPSDIKKAIVSPLPLVMMHKFFNDFKKSSDIEELNDEADQVNNELPTLTKLKVSLCEVGGQASTNPATKEVPNITKPVKKKIIKCSECEKIFNNADERKDHFLNNNKLPIMINLCSKCGLLCPTECSFKAHKRLHLQVSPYVCPECGDNPDRYWENFQKHLRYQCLHYSRLAIYKCPVCMTLEPSLSALKKHLLTKHILGLIKCKACPMVFKTLAAFYEHRTKNHGSTSINCMMIFQCGLCDGAFVCKDSIVDHMDTHGKCICQYAFKCPECPTEFLAKELLHEHMRSTHLKVYSQYVNVMNEADTSEEENVLEFNCSKFECLFCHRAFAGHQGYSLHITKSHSCHKYPCGICGVTLRSRGEGIVHGKGHLRSNIPLCLLCHSPFTTPESLDEHLLYHVERIKYRTACIVCGKGLFNFQETLQHLRSEHYLRKAATADSLCSSSTQNQEISISEQKLCGGLNVHDDASNYSPLPKMSSSISVPMLEVKKEESCSSSKKMKYQSGHCFKCSFASTDRAEFKTHILSHKPTPSCFQCMECGNSYIVEPALKLHLKMHHHILDTDKYVEIEGTHYIPENNSSQESTKTNDLECSVCFETFASENLLKRHMRSHGMAFIQAMKKSLH